MLFSISQSTSSPNIPSLNQPSQDLRVFAAHCGIERVGQRSAVVGADLKARCGRCRDQRAELALGRGRVPAQEAERREVPEDLLGHLIERSKVEISSQL